MQQNTITQCRELLKNVFGYDNFRPLQQEIITASLSGRDSLVVMPTGGGKSLCYQIPALIFTGLTIVVSPLISLMKDQVDQMKQLGIDAILLNRSITREEYNTGIEMIRSGKARLLYVAPETLLKNGMIALLLSVKGDCLAIDEAHCISEWGHDFRPEYRMIAGVRKQFPGAVCMALTATATERVRNDIRKNLGFTESSDFIASFNRDNLFYRIIPKDNPLEQTIDFLHKHKNESGIIYTFSRGNVERIYETLKKHGFSVRPYHAGLPDSERKENQDLFLKDDVQIIVATIAFGMGIHKTNVRFVIHFDLPKSIEAYYQETGRAGRDGVKSECLLLYSYSDIHKIKYFINQKTDETEKLASLTQLDSLVSYADSGRCRRIPLITYFGEPYNEENCDMCDNCVAPAETAEDITTQARMFLSCIKRTGEKFGAGHIIDILRGSRSKKIMEFGHNILSTYGIGKDLSKAVWQGLAQEFIRKGLIYQDTGSYGELKITGKGLSVLKGNEQVQGRAVRLRETASYPVTNTNHDNRLFEILREKRRELAAAENVPPYIVFSDKTLIDICTRYPQTTDELISIHGIGTHKMQKYGQTILTIVIEYCAVNNIETNATATPVQREYIKTPRHVEIGELYNTGCSIKEIEEAAGIKQSTIISNLNKYIQDGYSIKSAGLTSLLPKDADLLARITAVFDRHSTDYLKPVYEELNGVVDYDTLQICRLYYLSSD